jgi:hypothetical protein
VHSDKNKHHGDREDENPPEAAHSLIKPCASSFFNLFSSGDSRASSA